MGGNASAAEAVVRVQQSASSPSQATQAHGRFHGRQVSHPGADGGNPPPRAIQQAATGQAESSAGGGGRRTVGNRLTRAARSFFRVTADGASRRPAAASAGTGVRRSAAHTPPAGHGPEPAGRPLAGGGREPLSSARLPWLTPGENRARLTLDRCLRELHAHPGIPPDSAANLSAVHRLVETVEQDLLRLHALLEQSRTEFLSDAEWRELEGLLAAQNDVDSPPRRELNDRFARLAESAAPGSPIERMSYELQQRLALARACLASNEPPWSGAPRRIATVMPIGSRTPLEVDCRVVLGTALGARFPEGYPGNDIGNPYPGTLFDHVPGLALTTASRPDGTTLVSALSHGLICARGLDAEFLTRLSDADLKTMVGALLVGEDPGAREGRGPNRAIDDRCRTIKASPVQAALQAMEMRRAACLRMARETVTAALVADTEKFQRALAGEAVDLTLCSITLLEPDDLDIWQRQAEAFDALSAEPRLSLSVCDADGTPRTVSVNFRVRQFFLKPDHPLDEVFTPDYRSTTDLLGPAALPGLSGDARVRVNALNQRIGGLRHARQSLEPACTSQSAHSPQDRHRSPAAQERRVGSLAEISSLELRARSLQQAAEQLKAMWGEDGRRAWPTDSDARRAVAARLVLVGHLMGETPALCSSNSRLLEEEIQPEAVCVASTACHLGGFVAPVDLNPVLWGPVRNSFVERRQGGAPAPP